MKIAHDPHFRRFTLSPAEGNAELDYEISDATMTITHTFVSPALRGQGIAGHLMRAALKWAGEEKLKVVPQCSYAARFLDEHPEFNAFRADSG